jgi:hypothetical protein
MQALLVAKGGTVGENGPAILPKWRLFTPFRDLLDAANLRHGANGFISLPKEGILRIFTCMYDYFNPSGCTMALGLTQPLTEMSTRNNSLGVGG